MIEIKIDGTARRAAHSRFMRMHFHLNECGTLTEDVEGREVGDIAAAHELALKAAREVMCAELADGRLCLSCHIEVVDSAGERLLFVPFRDAVTITGYEA